VSVQLRHAPTAREFPARSVDISPGGMLMYVPAETPVAVGQAVKVVMPAPAGGGLAESVETLDATIAHVDRDNLLLAGRLSVGVKFEKLIEPPRIGRK
jgi:c-di-GMP-binding flagellar brake protein YcgR